MNNFNFDIAIELLRADGSITVNKSLIQAIGLNEAVLYCELLSRYNYFKTKEILDEEGYFYNTQYDLQAGTGLGEKAQRTAINNLKKIGLIKVKLKGLPAKRHFKIIPNSELLAKLLENGKKKAERLANPTDTSIGGNLKRQRKELVADDRSGNNTHYNNTNLNNTNLIKGYKGGDKSPRCVFSFDILDIQIENIMNSISNNGVIGNLDTNDIKEFFRMYYNYGGYMRNIKPTKLKNEQIENIITSISYISKADYNPSLDDYKKILIDYFNQDFPDCDYGINHFISGDVLLMRFYNLRPLLE